MTFPRDLLIFLPCLSLTREWSRTWEVRQEYKREREKNQHCDPSNYCFVSGFSLFLYLSKRQLSCQLCTEHHHPCNPEEYQVAARLQDGVGVEALEVGGLWEVRVVVITQRERFIQGCVLAEEVRYLLRPAEHGEGKQPRGEPRIQDVRVWHRKCVNKKYM